MQLFSKSKNVQTILPGLYLPWGVRERFPSSIQCLCGAEVSCQSTAQPTLRANEALSVSVSIAQPHNTVRKSRREERELLVPSHYANTNTYHPYMIHLKFYRAVL